MKVVTVIGARPQFVKASVVSRLFSGRQDVREILVHTGQHYDENMSERFFVEMGIPAPQYNLNIGSGSHGLMTGRMLEGVEKVLDLERPDWLLTYGDTNSTLAGALAAAKLKIPVAHVEAGLRSFNRSMPEELNRVLTDHISMLLFAPTDAAVANLAAEGIVGPGVRQVGDIMYDALLHFECLIPDPAPILAQYKLQRGSYILATIHRAENTDDASRLAAIVHGFLQTARRRLVVWPVHPRTRVALDRWGYTAALNAACVMLPPVGYLDMIALERSASLVVTDSGGVQKEAFCLRVPCVTLRDETEWVELVALGANRVVPPVSSDSVADAMMQRSVAFPDIVVHPFGDGSAGERIVAALLAL